MNFEDVIEKVDNLPKIHILNFSKFVSINPFKIFKYLPYIGSTKFTNLSIFINEKYRTKQISTIYGNCFLKAFY